MRESRARRTLLAILVVLGAGLAAQLAYAQQSTSPVFDHFSTGFPLVGSHFGVDCESCHQGGRFKGTPDECGACHDGSIRRRQVGQPHRHHPADARLATRARRASPAPPSATPASSGCASCHDGQTATGKPANHIVTTEPCETCHRSTATFAGAAFDHTGISRDCASCHNGQTATGKPATHIATTAALRDLPQEHGDVRRRHASITPASARDCASCHNGQTATGKPANHIATTAACETCHRSTASFAGAALQSHRHHRGNCASCHNGQTATGKPANHIVTTAALRDLPPSTASFAGATLQSHRHHRQLRLLPQRPDGDRQAGEPHRHHRACETCHRSTASFAGATFSHTGITGTAPPATTARRRPASRRTTSPPPRLRDLPPQHGDASPAPRSVTPASPATARPATTARRRPASRRTTSPPPRRARPAIEAR